MAELARPTPPDLTREEIDEICHPLVQNAAKVRFLARLGVTVERRPDGSPLVNREHYVRVRGGTVPDAEASASAGPVWNCH